MGLGGMADSMSRLSPAIVRRFSRGLQPNPALRRGFQIRRSHADRNGCYRTQRMPSVPEPPWNGRVNASNGAPDRVRAGIETVTRTSGSELEKRKSPRSPASRAQRVRPEDEDRNQPDPTREVPEEARRAPVAQEDLQDPSRGQRPAKHRNINLETNTAAEVVKRDARAPRDSDERNPDTD